MNGSHFALQDELVVGIDDDGLILRVRWHQTQIAFIASGEVDLLHRQSAVDEGYHDVAVRNLLRTVSQADVTIKESKANHRLSLDTDKVRGLGVMNKFLVQIKALMLVITRRRRESSCQSFVVGQLQPLGILERDVLGSVDRFVIFHLLYLNTLNLFAKIVNNRE